VERILKAGTTFHFANVTWIFTISVSTGQRCTQTLALTSLHSVATTQKGYSTYKTINCEMLILRLSKIVCHIHSFLTHITTHFVTLPTMIWVIRKLTMRMCVSMVSNLQFVYILMVLHVLANVFLASLLATSHSISLKMKLIYGHCFLGRRCIDWCPGTLSTSSVQHLSTSSSGTLQWQSSATSLCPTHYSLD